jgi:hypothetical protein
MDDSPRVVCSTVEQMVSDEHLVSLVIQRMKPRLHRTMFGHDGEFEDFDLQHEAKLAVCLGVHRARMRRYLDAKGYTTQTLKDLRREHGVSVLRRQHDTQLLLTSHPEFVDFVCTPPLTQEEVLDSACVEFRDLIAGPGTWYHEKQRTARSRKQPEFSEFDPGDYNPLDEYRTPDHPLGPAFSRAAAVAIELYGWCGLYWIAQKAFFEDEQAALLVQLGGVDPEADQREYWRLRKDLNRKLPQMGRRIMDALKEDPMMREFYEDLFGEGGNSPTPEKMPVPIIQEERTMYRHRLKRRLLARLAQDGSIEAQELTSRVENASPDDVADVLALFAEVEIHKISWRVFLRSKVTSLLAA